MQAHQASKELGPGEEDESAVHFLCQFKALKEPPS